MMDIKVAFTSQGFVPDAKAALESATRLAERLHIAHRPLNVPRQPNRFPHGFIGYEPELFKQFNPKQLEHYKVREVRGMFYLLEDGPLQQSPYYQRRVAMLEAGQESLEGEVEALGLRLAFHPSMYTITLQFITLHEKGERFGTFVGQLLPDLGGEPYFPSSEIDERTGLFGVLVHMQMLEFLAALKLEAVPSLYILDPTGYLENGDVLELMTTFEGAGFTYQRFMEMLAIPEDATLEQQRELKAFWRLPETEDKTLALPDLRGEVGSEGRIATFEEFLFLSGVAPVDIDNLIAEGR